MEAIKIRIVITSEDCQKSQVWVLSNKKQNRTYFMDTNLMQIYLAQQSVSTNP